MKEFFENYDLYQEYLLLENYALNNEEFTFVSEFFGVNFDYFCPLENSIRPFELDFPDSIKKNISKEFALNEYDVKLIPDENFINDKLNYTFWAFGKCKSCENHKVHFLLNVYSNNPISNIRDNYRNIQLSNRVYDIPKTNIYIRKIGCSDEKVVIIEKYISKFFDRESNNWLFKAKKLLQQNYGIGSFVYFRRIIEKELIQIIEDIKNLPSAETYEIQKLLNEYNEKPYLSTIYENIYRYLPNSLKDLGDNPIALLYNYTSKGLHNLNEKECLRRAKNIEKILEFTLNKIYNEKSEIKSIKEAIKKIK